VAGVITSLSNPQVKYLVRLRERRERDRSGLFLIEGYRELLRAKEGGVDIVETYVSPDHFLGTNEGALLEGLPRTDVSAAVFNKVSYRDRPDGLLAIARQQRRTLATLAPCETPLYLIAESIEKPGNLGSMLRSCDAAGVDAFILCDAKTDMYNPNVVRSSVGTLFTVPVIEAGSEEAISFLQERAIPIIAATPSGTRRYTDVDMRGGAALVVGTEQLGLTDLWLERADTSVSIPMKGHADSLNVASAATLLIYEVLRQRGASCNPT
jgi:TrmH family RNA methyltransferase